MDAFRRRPGEARQDPRFAPRSFATNLLLARLFFKPEEEGDDNNEASGFILFGSRSGDRRCRRFKCGTWQDGVRGSGIWSRPEGHEKKQGASWRLGTPAAGSIVQAFELDAARQPGKADL